MPSFSCSQEALTSHSLMLRTMPKNSFANVGQISNLSYQCVTSVIHLTSDLICIYSPQHKCKTAWATFMRGFTLPLPTQRSNSHACQAEPKFQTRHTNEERGVSTPRSFCCNKRCYGVHDALSKWHTADAVPFDKFQICRTGGHHAHRITYSQNHAAAHCR